MIERAHPPRHHLVWLRPSWRAALRAPVAPDLLEDAVRWIGRGLPAVAARRAADDDARGLCLGVALPGPGRRRVALRVAPAAVARVTGPLALRDALVSAPGAWRDRLAALDAEARAAGLVAAVYGSLAWQHLSGERYVTEASDVDVLLAPRTAAELRAALDLFRAHLADRAPALDGELLLPGGRAVSGREVASGASRVLVKSGTTVALEPAGAALGVLAEVAP